jgi:predicted Zn-dependent protease with MMP-like domain
VAVVVDLTLVTEERFEQLAAEALDGLPEWVRERMDNIEVLIASLPPPDRPGLAGLYEGIPLTRRGIGYGGVLPDRITLYRSTIVRGAASEAEVRQRVGRVVMHEVAHFFGISDDRLRELDRY